MQTRADNQGDQNEGCWLEIFHLLIETIKATGINSLWVNFWEINQVTPKCQIDFFDKTCEHHHQILHIWNGLGIKFQLKPKIFNILTKLTQKGYLKKKKMKITIEFYKFRLLLVSNFSFNKQLWFFETISQIRILQNKNRKNEHHQWILHIRITLIIKFLFWTYSFQFLD